MPTLDGAHGARILLLGIALIAGASAAAAQSASGISGTVIDEATGEPVVAAAITLRDLAANTQVRIASSRSGLFEHAVAAGRWAITVERAGYFTHNDTVAVRAGALTGLMIALRVAPLPVDSVAVKAVARRDHLGGFWERRERNTGYFFTREDIERIRPLRVPDLFRKVPGAKILKGPNGLGQWVSFDRYRRIDGTVCPAALYVDGRAYVPSPTGLDDFLPDDIEAIEAYSGAARIPAEFNATGKRGVEPRCGVIVIWTRRGGS